MNMPLRIGISRLVGLSLSLITMFVSICLHAMVEGAADRPGVLIENVKLRQIEAVKFRRISEFFTGKENTSGRVFLRSHPEERGGLYFITRTDVKLTELPWGMTVGVDFFEAGSAQMRQYFFKLPADFKATNKLFIGITEDGMLEKPLPVAWRVYFLDAEEQLYAELKSYLWEMPESDS